MSPTDLIYKKLKLPEPYDEESKNDFLTTKLLLISMVVFSGLIIAVIILSITNASMSNRLSEALNQPAMIGIQTASGIYKSSKTIPKQLVKDMAELWISNWKNNSRSSYKENIDYAVDRMTDKLKEKTKLAVLQKKLIVSKQGVETSLKEISLDVKMHDKFSFEVDIFGTLTKSIKDRQISDPAKVKYKLFYCGITPTATNPLALAVCDIEDPELSNG